MVTPVSPPVSQTTALPGIPVIAPLLPASAVGTTAAVIVLAAGVYTLALLVGLVYVDEPLSRRTAWWAGLSLSVLLVAAAVWQL
ncbi:uncharacterized protein Nmag_2409 [Natrialba magadii ATCC 43099]|uniref:Uncharacterized protein n=1 Tax=Natrialba magadii (strain ATCC 43099 / DSM 3394 / CCM 3739 / CIP 104546 / IAM 13178 / JCM 8861 / NBRC 102185 / NCIMB 2190 / MS3) TaxID=547559 RepID=D3SXM1_NATMM|nr:hypothetical protein [Natrialba magadii]ADD05970.1 uncharacterized protein Nmag_2409 [Natrialba magadii ATCC 43099]ELY30522.1 hypothetical protein C500_08372 [Natrialba magadii ATCC 43099]